MFGLPFGWNPFASLLSLFGAAPVVLDRAIAQDDATVSLTTVDDATLSLETAA